MPSAVAALKSGRGKRMCHSATPASTQSPCASPSIEPDIPQNVGTILRLGACLGVPLDIIEPCGFLFDDQRLRRAGMDYLDRRRSAATAPGTPSERDRQRRGRAWCC